MPPLKAVGARIISMVEDSGRLTIRVPKQASVAAIEALASRLEGTPGVESVNLDRPVLKQQAPPSNYGSIVIDSRMSDLAAARAPAAWNATEALMTSAASLPRVIVADFFGVGGFGTDIAATLMGGGFNSVPPDPDSHGIGVLSRIAADFGGAGSDDRSVMAAVAPLNLTEPKRVLGIHIIDAASSTPGTSDTDNAVNDYLVQELRAVSGKAVVNTSIGACDVKTTCTDTDRLNIAIGWLERLRGKENVRFPGALENKFVHFVAAGNIPGAFAQLNSEYSAAALRGDLTDSGGLRSPRKQTRSSLRALTRSWPSGVPEPGCLSSFSSDSSKKTAGYALAAFGNGTYSANGNTGVLLAKGVFALQRTTGRRLRLLRRRRWRSIFGGFGHR